MKWLASRFECPARDGAVAAVERIFLLYMNLIFVFRNLYLFLACTMINIKKTYSNCLFVPRLLSRLHRIRPVF